ncbi:MAG: penicillin acylase family protein, partial [Emcibacteraceae bacterium]|nr:penicillin acylase family protein [Emcibacteraceae bacterium]
MKKLLLLTTILAVSACSSQDGAQTDQANDNNAMETSSVSNEVAKWEAQAAGITIQRDEWGVPHIYGKTDADAVFGVMYAQAE